jgi:O-antigen ligase
MASDLMQKLSPWAIGLFALALSAAFYFEWPWLAVLPVIIAFAWLAIVRLDAFILLLIGFVPLSLSLEDMELGGLGLYLPTEPMLAALMVLFLVRSMRGWPIEKLVLKHPFSWLVSLSLLWIFFTALTSSHPIVSLKFLVSRAWFIIGFLWVLGHFFVHQPDHRHKFIMAYVFPLCIVVIYTVIRHAGFGFEKDAGHWVMKPFFKDHTSYGAVLAMITPPLLSLLCYKRFPPVIKALLIAALCIIGVGLLLSYTRAAWVSLAAVGVLWGLMRLKFQLRTLITMSMLLLAFGWFAREALVIQLERNNQDSSDNLTEHVESISNVSSDASNLERLNRWNAALALFLERPIVGWGPGSYQFVYAPFQQSKNRTIISTNNADGGNAHSEYLGPLAEQGILGLIWVLGLLGFCLHWGFRLQRVLIRSEDRLLAMGVFLGLMTYFVHGVLNNYLDTDKASALFWGYFAIMLALDLQSSSSKKSNESVKITT